MLDDIDLDDFWEDSDYARKEYVEGPVTDHLVASVEATLGFTLPRAYVALMRSQNGGLPKRTCFRTKTRTSWADDHVAITGIMGIGRNKTYSLLGKLGSHFMQEQWGYPDFGVCVCDCPSAGHDMIMLDYRACGPEGEPAVVHVDQERDLAVTFLAPDFETFVRGLVHASEFDESEAELAEALARIDGGTFSTELAGAIRSAPDPIEAERTLRRLLRAVATEKGYFALHGDPLSHLVYDALFQLYADAREVLTGEQFLETYADLIALGDGEVTTGGYAPGFIAKWMETRRGNDEIVERDGRLTLSDGHRRSVAEQLARFA
ncbi:MAG: SMI1/KNR4 family protein [Sandaracinaceae bacterium]